MGRIQEPGPVGREAGWCRAQCEPFVSCAGGVRRRDGRERGHTHIYIHENMRERERERELEREREREHHLLRRKGASQLPYMLTHSSAVKITVNTTFI